MARHRTIRSLTTAVAALSLATGTVASAATVPAAAVNPLVALSVFGTAQSQAAVCAVGGSSAAATAATTAQAPGCVLPVTEPAPVAVVTEPPPPYVPPPVEARGFNFLPLLVGLAAIVAAYFLLDDVFLGDDDDDDVVPISPA